MEQNNNKKILVFSIFVIIFIISGLSFYFFSSKKESVREKEIISREVLENLEIEGVKNISSNRLDEARRVYERITFSDKETSNAHVQLGIIAENMGDIIEAENQYKIAIGIEKKKIFDQGEGDNVENKISSSTIEGILRNSPVVSSGTSILELIKNINKNTTSVVSYDISPAPFIYLGRIYLKQEKLSEAKLVLEDGVMYTPNYPDFYLILSEIYKKMGDTKQAEAYMQKFNDLTKK